MVFFKPCLWLHTISSYHLFSHFFTCEIPTDVLDCSGTSFSTSSCLQLCCYVLFNLSHFIVHSGLLLLSGYQCLFLWSSFSGSFVCTAFDARSTQNQFCLLRGNLNTLQRQSTTSHNPSYTAQWKPDFLKSEITAQSRAQMLPQYKTIALFSGWSWSYNSRLSVSRLSLICYGHCHLPPPLQPPLVMWA